MKALSKLLLGTLGLVFCYCIAARAQVASPSPAAVSAAVVSSGSWISSLIASKGGFMAFGLLLITCFNITVSALQSLCLTFDGIAPGATVPPEDKVLTLMNKICGISGKILSWVGSNVQH